MGKKILGFFKKLSPNIEVVEAKCYTDGGRRRYVVLLRYRGELFIALADEVDKSFIDVSSIVCEEVGNVDEAVYDYLMKVVGR